MWSRSVGGRQLHFHIAGVNNQNLLLADDETGSWWQQVTGECILGSLRGTRLERIPSDEVTLEIWRREHPLSTAVRFNPKYLDQYPKSDWEQRIAQVPTVGGDNASPLPPRELVVGVEAGAAATAFPVAIIRRQSPVNAQVGAEPVLVVAGEDGNSVRVFSRRLAGQTLEFYQKPGQALLIDAATASTWDFTGHATSGPLQGRALPRVEATKDYWFDWHRYHPQTRVYRTGSR